MSSWPVEVFGEALAVVIVEQLFYGRRWSLLLEFLKDTYGMKLTKL